MVSAFVRPRPAAHSALTRGQRELLFFLGAYGVYNAARWVFTGDEAAAMSHAHSIVGLERSLRISIEPSVHAALSSGVWGWLLSNIYLAAQLAVLPGSLYWLYRKAPDIYRHLRSTVLATWLIAVPVFALYPVAPPRLAHLGMSDTVSEQAGFALTGRSTLFYNPLAAVPSLHVGFAFAIGIAVAAAVHSRWAKSLALLWGPVVTLAVVATANHYIFDAVTGLVVSAAGYAAGQLVLRRARPRGGRPRSEAVRALSGATA
jgi:hypothetical protein